MSQLGVILQEALRREREARTIVGFLRAKMERLERERRRRNLKDRLGFTAMGCCGATWGCRAAAISVREEDEDEDDELQHTAMTNTDQSADPCLNHSPAPFAMNLAAALAAERRLRSSPQEIELEVEAMSGPGPETGTETAGRVSLMRLLEESDGGEKEEKRAEGNDSVCCVCMGRKKGAAFIPCGHTFCRVCSRELWLNRGSCPLCNRSILEILDIF